MRRARHRRRRLAFLTVGATLAGGAMLFAYTPAQQQPAASRTVIAPPPLAVVSSPVAIAGEAAAQAIRSRTDPAEAALASAGPVAGNTTAAPAPAETVEARPGDTPLKLLARIGVAPEDAQEAARKLAAVWDPRDLRPGQKAAVLTQADRLLSFRLALAPDRDIVVARDDTGGFVAEDQDRPVRQVATLGSGTIHTSLSAAASRAGVPAGVLGEMVHAFSYDVDFQREIHPGDTFTVLYERVDDEFGRPTGTGYLAYAEMVLSGTSLRLYRFTPKGGEPGYYTESGESSRKPLLRTPIDGARISSGFGMRLHPILGYSRMHKGVDFAAPSGTAIYAAGDGVVVHVGRVNGYGNFIEVQHNGQYTTAYGHLSAYARGLHEGEKVRQGEVIGYVGMTGTATGPHLHYEVHYQGAQVDPLSIKMPVMTRLAGDDLKAFSARRATIERQLIALRQDRIARYECRGTGC
jgi:murein DD-endopeptidase MepM/ murein hydrolase activator NlpD